MTEPDEGAANARPRHREHHPLVSFILVVALMVISTLVVKLSTGDPPASHPLAVVQVLVGSESKPLLTDPKVVAAFARHGFQLVVQDEGSRQMAADAQTCAYDLAIPSSQPVADEIAGHCPHAQATYPVFSSPMVVVTFEDILPLLVRLHIASRDQRTKVWTFDMRQYVHTVTEMQRWSTIPGNTTYPDSQNLVLLSTTDPQKSNSAAMYTMMLSYVLNHDSVITSDGQAATQATCIEQRFFLPQGYLPPTTGNNFDSYVSSLGEAQTPMSLVYEAQFLEHEITSRDPGLVVMYPSPTAVAIHAVVPLNRRDDQVGRLLSGETYDADIIRAEAAHGWRDQGQHPTFASTMTQHGITMPSDINNALLPAYSLFEALLNDMRTQESTGPGCAH